LRLLIPRHLGCRLDIGKSGDFPSSHFHG
jgi:hypothetical protein